MIPKNLWRALQLAGLGKSKMTWTDIDPEGGDASGGDVVAQEIQLRDGEYALLQVEGQAVGGEDGE
jgi:hypothetical protein